LVALSPAAAPAVAAPAPPPAAAAVTAAARHGQRYPVLLVQGYLEPGPYFMYGIYRHLQEQGWQVYGINLFPNVTAAAEQAAKIRDTIAAIRRETGAERVNLVCHSFGGLISRFYIQQLGGARYVDRYVSIATPHHGTLWGAAGLGQACTDMRIGGTFLTALNSRPVDPSVRYFCIWSRTDPVVLPAESAILAGAWAFPPVPLTEHFLILWSPTTYRYVDEALSERA
jgi:triacylglycerol lipase